MPSPVTVTGNLQSLLATNAKGALVEFTLINSQWNIPYVAGVTNMIDTQVYMIADSSGNISGSLWGNDVITPAGTQYLVTIGRVSNVYNIVGSAWNLNTATPATVPPSGSATIPNAESPLAVTITGIPVGGGNFTLPHTLGYVPRGGYVQLTSLGIIVFQSSFYDANNIYLTASDGSLTGRVLIW